MLFVLLFFCLFILPGLIVYFQKEEELAAYIIKIISTSITINIFSLSLLLLHNNSINLVLIIFNLFFSIFLASIIKFLFFINKKPRKLKKPHNWFLFILFLTFFLNFLLMIKYKHIVGADVGRFAIISHALYLKGIFETNLYPYDLAQDLFYFPAIILFPFLFELVGVDPISFFSFLTFFFSSIYGLPIYLITKKLLKKEEIALSSFFFSSLFFNPILNLGFFGVFPYAISIFFFLSFLYFLLEIEKKNYFDLFISLFGIYSFHLYTLILIIPFLVSLFLLKPKIFLMLKNKCFWKNFSLFLIFLLPYLFYTFASLFIPLEIENKADISIFSTFNKKLSLTKKISYILFSTPNGFRYNIISVIGILLFIFSLFRFYKTLKKSIKFLLISFITSFLLSLILFNDMNFGRSLWIFWFFYSISFATIFSDMKANLIILLISYIYSISPSIFSYFTLQPTFNRGQIPWIVWNEFYDAIDFIKSNIPINSTFLIDGGGAGCTGASASYGERIFPLTSRKIFYFSDYCWAKYDKNEYRNRVNLYREISINPNNLNLVNKLKEYNITHIFIGPTDVGLNKNLFLNSSFYRLIYDNGAYTIFQIL